jgi:hypothetical protein
MGASSHERKIKSTHRSQHHPFPLSISPSSRLSPTKWLFASCSSERNQFRYHLALSMLYSGAPSLAGSQANESRSLVARLIKCEIPLSSFAFVNSSSNPPAPARSSSSALSSSALLIPPTDELFPPSFHPPSRASPYRVTPFLGRVRRPWKYIAANVEIA